ncbi:calmodulin-binding protein, partial [Genlisea aurea]
KSQHGNLPLPLSGEEIENAAAQNLDKSMPETGTENYSFMLKKPLLNTLQSEESLKKVDSFSRWMVKELGEADELAMQPSSGISWSIIGNEYESNMPAQLEVDTETLSPSISQDQLFSITDFSPHWAFSNRQTKVLIAGMFLKGEAESSECSWSIMFGQVEVPAEVLRDGILCCTAPLHDPGLLPFYVTCSNRLACSEVREFEYRADSGTITALDEVNEASASAMHLYQRFEMILQLKANENPLICTGNDFDKHAISLSITSLREEDNSLDERLSSENDLLHLGELLIEKKLRKQFFSWILHRVDDHGIGLTVCDEGGQSVLHLAAALGFSWSFQPFLIAGVRVDFRDVNGWTALHWAAFYGREEAVVALVSFGANPGALTDPCNAFPLSRTPADLASSRGHKGISGFLAESDLTTHLSALRVQDDDGAADASAVQTHSERVAAPTVEEDILDKLSLKDSVAAICNAAQAAARIHQIFRIQSFQRKKFIEHSSDELQTLDDQVISLAAGKASRLGHSHGMANAAATQIQKNYRSWKKRKEFLLIRQKIVKIQAHVRGHQARKKYKNFSWSVGIVEKVILRWRRKKNGLRRHQPDGDQAECSMQDGFSVPLSPPRDDYEAWKKGRKETELRMEKALARVKSMAQHPEARAQYRRLLTAAEVLRESKDTLDIEIPDALDDNMALSDDNLIDFGSFLDDETFMNLAFQ